MICRGATSSIHDGVCALAVRGYMHLDCSRYLHSSLDDEVILGMDPRDKKRSSRTPFQSSISTASSSSPYVGCFPIDSPLAATADMQRYTPFMLLARGYMTGRMLVCGADYGKRSKGFFLPTHAAGQEQMSTFVVRHICVWR